MGCLFAKPLATKANDHDTLTSQSSSHHRGSILGLWKCCAEDGS
jgi:hypothetical protein